MAAAIEKGDDPAIVAEVIVAAATDPKPKLRYTAGVLAGRASTLRRFASRAGLRQSDPQAEPVGLRRQGTKEARPHRGRALVAL
jgi:hypothetical protein